MTKVKICGITNLEDALLAAKFGADALGFNFYPKSPRYIEPEKAREIIEKLPPEVSKVGVFVNESLEKIAEIAETARLDVLQLHGEETPEFARELKGKTGFEIIKAFRVSPEFKPEDVLQYETDAILLDAYNPKEHGGTGETFDWEIAKRVQEIFPKMYLAGGLSPENIRQAIFEVNPFFVDVCSNLEYPKGKKDLKKIEAFIGNAGRSNWELEKPELFKNESIPFPKNIFQYLNSSLFRKPPHGLLGKKSFTNLFFFIWGYRFGFEHKTANYDVGFFFYGFFKHWVEEKLGFEKDATKHWTQAILQKVDDNEEAAFDLFFELLDEFEAEHKDLFK